MTNSCWCGCWDTTRRTRRPRRLELINIGEFPGAVRFIGLGQLPPEALRMLWAKRRAGRRRAC